MALNLTSFELAGKQVIKLGQKRQDKLLVGLWSRLVSDTPVLTGAARSNWRLTPGRPATAVNVRDGRIYGRPATPNIKRYTDRWNNWYITNTSPYIVFLNQGSSKKAPKGFIESAVLDYTVLFNSGSL